MTAGLTFTYFLAAKLIENYAWQIRVQLFLDALTITWLVWRSGDITSPFISMFIVIISLSSIFLGIRNTILTAVICALLFTVLSTLVVHGVIPSFAQTPELSRTIQTVGTYDIALLLVGLLASRLSDRRAAVRET